MKIQNIAALILSFSLVACSDKNESETNVDEEIKTVTVTEYVDSAADVIISTRASDYSSGAHSGLQRNVDGSYTTLNSLSPTGTSDVTVASFGDYFYRIEKYSGENITKFSFHQPQTPIWQYSTKDNSDDLVSSNPSAIIFASDSKAYILRYGKAEAWIVNPSAQTEDAFKIGTLDLSAYGADDGIPDMHNGVIVDGKLFITMQRLKAFNPDPSNPAYVAVFDVETDLEVDTDTTDAAENLKGIALGISNPNSTVSYLTEDNSVYVAGIGSYSPTEYSGGIEKINVSSYAKTLVLDDGDIVNEVVNAPNGKISNFAIKSSTIAYFVGYDGFANNSLYAFNPVTGVATKTNNPLLSGVQISSLTFDGSGDLWVSSFNNGGDVDAENDIKAVYIIDSLDDSVIDVINTDLVPEKVLFE